MFGYTERGQRKSMLRSPPMSRQCVGEPHSKGPSQPDVADVRLQQAETPLKTVGFRVAEESGPSSVAAFKATAV